MSPFLSFFFIHFGKLRAPFSVPLCHILEKLKDIQYILEDGALPRAVDFDLDGDMAHPSIVDSAVVAESNSNG
jgi:hypothetical protein